MSCVQCALRVQGYVNFQSIGEKLSFADISAINSDRAFARNKRIQIAENFVYRDGGLNEPRLGFFVVPEKGETIRPLVAVLFELESGKSVPRKSQSSAVTLHRRLETNKLGTIKLA